MLTALTDRKRVQDAIDSLRRALTAGCQSARHLVGWQGESRDCLVRWNPKHGYWCTITREIRGKSGRLRSWFALGLGKQDDAPSSLSIVVELNVPLDGVNRRVAGCFAQDGAGAVYLLHSGRVGGGRAGIGRESFLSHLDSPNLHSVAWPDGTATEMILIGRVDSSRFPSQVTEFIRAASAFKELVASGAIPTSNRSGSVTDEFAGQRKAYRITHVIESTCDHGYVYRSLRGELEREGIKGVDKDRDRDLFVWNGSSIRLLFEIKTSMDSQSMFTGIGQLMLHSALDVPVPKRVLVLPEWPTKAIATRIRALGLHVVKYTLRGTQATFAGLREVLCKEGMLGEP